jgi:hypothetical protein
VRIEALSGGGLSVANIGSNSIGLAPGCAGAGTDAPAGIGAHSAGAVAGGATAGGVTVLRKGERKHLYSGGALPATIYLAQAVHEPPDPAVISTGAPALRSNPNGPAGAGWLHPVWVGIADAARGVSGGGGGSGEGSGGGSCVSAGGGAGGAKGALAAAAAHARASAGLQPPDQNGTPARNSTAAVAQNRMAAAARESTAAAAQNSNAAAAQDGTVHGRPPAAAINKRRREEAAPILGGMCGQGGRACDLSSPIAQAPPPVSGQQSDMLGKMAGGRAQGGSGRATQLGSGAWLFLDDSDGEVGGEGEGACQAA